MGHRCHVRTTIPIVVVPIVVVPVDAVAIAGVFSMQDPSQELEAAEVVRAELGDGVAVSLGHLVGGVGLLEREASAILNASLGAVVAFASTPRCPSAPVRRSNGRCRPSFTGT